MIVTRFAPSPNGPLHLGHAWSAIVAHDLARARGGRFLVRIEDIDGERSRADLAEEFRADLDWLGLTWEDVPPQSRRVADYAEAARRLREMNLLYPCRCTRAEIAAASASGMAAAGGTPAYPGTCRDAQFDPDQGPVAWRLNMARAVRRAGPLEWVDELSGEQPARPERWGDVVLVRKDRATPASYHLAVTLDDATDGVTLVTRGADLFPATAVHRLLQALLGLPVPAWHHHALLVDGEGHKLAKRRGSGAAGLGLAHRRRAGEDGRELADALREHRFPSGIRLVQRLDGEP